MTSRGKLKTIFFPDSNETFLFIPFPSTTVIARHTERLTVS